MLHCFQTSHLFGSTTIIRCPQMKNHTQVCFICLSIVLRKNDRDRELLYLGAPYRKHCPSPILHHCHVPSTFSLTQVRCFVIPAGTTSSGDFFAGFVASFILCTGLLLTSILCIVASMRARQLATASWLPLRVGDSLRSGGYDETLLPQGPSTKDDAQETSQEPQRE